MVPVNLYIAFACLSPAILATISVFPDRDCTNKKVTDYSFESPYTCIICENSTHILCARDSGSTGVYSYPSFVQLSFFEKQNCRLGNTVPLATRVISPMECVALPGRELTTISYVSIMDSKVSPTTTWEQWEYIVWPLLLIFGGVSMCLRLHQDRIYFGNLTSHSS